MSLKNSLLFLSAVFFAELPAQLRPEWIVDLSDLYEYPQAASAFTRKNNTIMFSYGADVYHITPHSLPVKTYTSSEISRAWQDKEDLICVEGCKVVARDFYSGAVKTETCLMLLDDTPTIPFPFLGQSGNYYYGAFGKWIGKYDKTGYRLDSMGLPHSTPNIMGFAVGKRKIFVSTYNVWSCRLLVYDTNLNSIIDQGSISYYNITADTNDNCYFIYPRAGYTEVFKTDSLFQPVWTTTLTNAAMRRFYLKGDSLFVTGQYSAYPSNSSEQKCGYAILNPHTGAIIDQTFVNLFPDEQWGEELVEIDSDGENIYASGVRSSESYGVPFVVKLSKNGATSVAEQASRDPKIYAASEQIRIKSLGLPFSKVIVHDAMGRTLHESKAGETEMSCTLSTSGWSAGLYLVDVVTGQSRYCKKVLVGMID